MNASSDHLRTVLIVEDDEDLAELERVTLEGRANVRLVTSDFGQALRPGTWVGVEIAVIDLMLPHLEGEDVCRFLRAEFPYIRLVICTAKPMYLIPSELADVVLQKPFDPDTFVSAVLNVSR